MHNCKAIQNDFPDLALNQTTPDLQARLAEIRQCPACDEEFAALQNVLRATAVAGQSAQPAESFWPGYHARLRQRLELHSQIFEPAQPCLPASVPVRWHTLLTASIRVPVPAALALLVFFAAAIFFMFHAGRSSAGIILAPPAVVTETIPLPLIQERVITRVVYKTNGRSTPRDLTPAPRDAAITPDRRDAAVAQGLEGFKPANEPKLTIIKGSNRDEK